MSEAAAAVEDPKQAAADAALVAPPAKGKLIPIMVVVNTVVMLGLGGLVVTKLGHADAAAKKPAAEGEHEGAAEEEEPAEAAGQGAKTGAGPTVKLDDFVVRLRNPEGDRFARVSFEVEVGGEKDKERLIGAMARVRDSFIGELTEHTAEELRGTTGLESMKATLTQRLKDKVPNCRVRGLYVTDFIVQ